MLDALPIFPAPFQPSTSLTGNEPLFTFRGENCRIRGVNGFLKITNYEGTKDLSEDYDISTETLTGTLSWTADDPTVTGSGTAFIEELHIGQFILASAEVFVVRSIISDTEFIAERAPTTNGSGVTARFMFVFFEIDKTRGVLQRGNAVKTRQGDIYLVGGGRFYRNAVSTGFSAERRPKRLEYNSDGSYTEFPVGFSDAPPVPAISVVSGGEKKLQLGYYSFMISYWNSKTRGFSNPTPVIKKSGAGTDLQLTVANSRFVIDLTTSLVNMPDNADGFVIWQSLSGGGVTAVNASYYAQGPWQMAARVKTDPRNILSADATADTLYIPEHLFKTGDILYGTGGSLPSGMTAATQYFAIVVDKNNIQIATSYANALAKTPVNITATGTGTVSPLDVNDFLHHEVLDAELGITASGDNDAPPDCEFLAEFSNTVFYISAFGKKTANRKEGSSPGNYVLMQKTSNREAAPTDWAVSVGEEITGFATGIGRLFCLTDKGIPFIISTGRAEISRLVPSYLDLPFTSRPFWTKGNINPYAITTIQGDVYVYSGRRVLMSPRNAIENSNPFEISLAIQDLLKDIHAGYVFLEHDPKNQQLCVIASACEMNGDNYWVSKIFPLDLETNQWQPTIKLSSATRDMIVTGAAIVNDRLEFLAGGRVQGGAFTLSTFRYDEPDGSTSVPYYFAIQPTDNGEELKHKRIKSFRVTGRITDAKLQVHGAPRGGTISRTDIEDGTNSISGDITLTDSTDIVRQFEKFFEVKNLAIWSLRFSGEWDGTSELDEIHEIVLQLQTHGGKK